MIEERLFRLAPEVLTLQATFAAGEGWRLVVRMRRQDEHWDGAVHATYSHLTTGELEQVMHDEVTHRLQ